jgi:hypothetical protein
MSDQPHGEPLGHAGGGQRDAHDGALGFERVEQRPGRRRGLRLHLVRGQVAAKPGQQLAQHGQAVLVQREADALGPSPPLEHDGERVGEQAGCGGEEQVVAQPVGGAVLVEEALERRGVVVVDFTGGPSGQALVGSVHPVGDGPQDEVVEGVLDRVVHAVAVEPYPNIVGQDERLVGHGRGRRRSTMRACVTSSKIDTPDHALKPPAAATRSVSSTTTSRLSATLR